MMLNKETKKTIQWAATLLNQEAPYILNYFFSVVLCKMQIYTTSQDLMDLGLEICNNLSFNNSFYNPYNTGYAQGLYDGAQDLPSNPEGPYSNTAYPYLAVANSPLPPNVGLPTYLIAPTVWLLTMVSRHLCRKFNEESVKNENKVKQMKNNIDNHILSTLRKYFTVFSHHDILRELELACPLTNKVKDEPMITPSGNGYSWQALSRSREGTLITSPKTKRHHEIIDLRKDLSTHYIIKYIKTRYQEKIQQLQEKMSNDGSSFSWIIPTTTLALMFKPIADGVVTTFNGISVNQEAIDYATNVIVPEICNTMLNMTGLSTHGDNQYYSVGYSDGFNSSACLQTVLNKTDCDFYSPPSQEEINLHTYDTYSQAFDFDYKALLMIFLLQMAIVFFYYINFRMFSYFIDETRNIGKREAERIPLLPSNEITYDSESDSSVIEDLLSTNNNEEWSPMIDPISRKPFIELYFNEKIEKLFNKPKVVTCLGGVSFWKNNVKKMISNANRYRLDEVNRCPAHGFHGHDDAKEKNRLIFEPSFFAPNKGLHTFFYQARLQKDSDQNISTLSGEDFPLPHELFISDIVYES